MGRLYFCVPILAQCHKVSEAGSGQRAQISVIIPILGDEANASSSELGPGASKCLLYICVRGQAAGHLDSTNLVAQLQLQSADVLSHTRLIFKHKGLCSEQEANKKQNMEKQKLCT